MKKMKLPGGNISLKTKKTEDPIVMAWLNAQSNLMDSFRYLVEKEIMLNGVRNLQAYIPMERTSLQDSSDPLGAGVYRQITTDRQQMAAAIEEVEAGSDELDSLPESEEETDAEEIDDGDIEAWS
ncbi:hypothetical protein [Paenibacillus sp. CF384]|uniref:hypothetical protein n=1 Tax=Paenibacillus sp. CF384 TaxID=1884382 RepID=UPI000897AD09|nr:hypothetical protein [Paenibacillus sp. CF384]SDW97523.1 hypothetical protein SAMN05518855_1007127 [Paenibacillus sp. CF384]